MVTLQELPTPSLLLDERKLMKNIEGLYQKCHALGATIRPHLKTAKSADILTYLDKSPMQGITVSTLLEAEYFSQAGVRDILYAVSIAPSKMQRALELQKSYKNLCLILDSVDVARALADTAKAHQQAIKVMIEIDVDGHRAGLLANDESLAVLAKFLTEDPWLEFSGLMTHAGESYACTSKAALKAHAQLEVDTMRVAKQFLAHRKIDCPYLSVGSTPTAHHYTELEGIDEVRAGVFVFYDLMMANLGLCDLEDIALGVLTTVISHKLSHKRLIIDAGGLALSKDRGTSSQACDYVYGCVVRADNGQILPHLRVNQANQEHGIIQLHSHQQFAEFPIGTQLIILPNHACMTAAAYDCYHMIDDSQTIRTIKRINGW